MTTLIGKPRKKATTRPKRFTSNANKAARKKEDVRFISKYTVYEYLEAPPKINVAKVANFVHY